MTFPIFPFIIFTVSILYPGMHDASCEVDSDCSLVYLPVCQSNGCAPPCGSIAETTIVAVAADQKADYQKRAREQAETACSKTNCKDCQGTLPTRQNFGDFRAECQAGFCKAVPK